MAGGRQVASGWRRLEAGGWRGMAKGRWLETGGWKGGWVAGGR